MSTDQTPVSSASATTRRQLLAMAAVGGAGAAAVAAAGPASAAGAAAGPGNDGEVMSKRLTVMGTSDIHGNVYNWDYYKDTEYDDSAHNDVGVAKASPMVKRSRREVRGERTLTIDAGDTIQGTPLAYYYAKQDPITDG